MNPQAAQDKENLPPPRMPPKSAGRGSTPGSSSSGSPQSVQSLPERPTFRTDSAAPTKPHKPQLKFVNSTNPEQLRTTQYRKVVKQHAMLDAQKRRREAMQADLARRRAQQNIAKPELLPDSNDSQSPPEGETLPLQKYTGYSSVDPFRTLPQFSNPLVDAERLQHLTLAYFPSLRKSQQYINTLTSSPIVFLADAHPGIILQDALDENPNGGVMTMAAKGEIYTLLNHRLRSKNPVEQLAPDVIAGIFNLILLEISYGNLKTITTHLVGLRRMMHIIGGSQKAGFDPNLATMAVYQGLVTAIYFDIPPERDYLRLSQMIKASNVSNEEAEMAWESPINGDDFKRTALNVRCSESTLWILRTMRTLKKRFLQARFRDDESLINNVTARSIYNNLLEMPSSSIPYLPTSDDFVYECIRITAILWATSFVYNVPMSVATSIAGQRMPDTPDPVEALVKALKKSGTNDCWGHGMMGNFLWVCKTGCIVAPNGSVPFKWVYLEQARAAVLGLRYRLYRPLLVACETVLQLQDGLRMPTQEAIT